MEISHCHFLWQGINILYFRHCWRNEVHNFGIRDLTAELGAETIKPHWSVHEFQWHFQLEPLGQHYK